nr:2-phytyl-1,4-beta-naphthoquinone methyltransferase, chloroplastic isoform X1 [Coffea arabica]XP_027098202.1 2-phytyl-1,4-beta-naphthoquinone methyltransferase, chloroplastic isoform X1 [Coffea arabica]
MDNAIMSAASLHRTLPALPGQHSRPVFRSKTRLVRCSNERQVLFDRIAPVYDNLNDLLTVGQHRIWKRMAISWSGAKKGDNVLDVCCGTGDLAFLLSEKVGPTGKVVGLDFSKQQLLIASSRQHSQSKTCYENIKWIEGNAIDLPFPESSFDAVTIGYGLRNVVDRLKVLEEVCRVLKPGSKVSALDFNKSTNPFSTSFQEWMIDYVVVPAADIYGLANEYRYLKRSINEFLTGKELERLALNAGFCSAKHFETGGGLMGNLVAVRYGYIP